MGNQILLHEYEITGFGRVKIKAFFLEESDKDHYLPIVLELVKDENGGKWAIYDNVGSVLSKIPDALGKYLFHLSRQPSNRNADYYKEYRFETAQAGFEFWQKNRPNIIATYQEKIAYYSLLEDRGLIE